MATHSFTCKHVIPAFTPQPQHITALWLIYSFTVPQRVEGCVDLGGWLHTEIKCRPGSRTRTVTVPVLTGLSVG